MPAVGGGRGKDPPAPALSALAIGEPRRHQLGHLAPSTWPRRVPARAQRQVAGLRRPATLAFGRPTPNPASFCRESMQSLHSLRWARFAPLPTYHPQSCVPGVLRVPFRKLVVFSFVFAEHLGPAARNTKPLCVPGTGCRDASWRQIVPAPDAG
jgi:hypothetical protein